MPVWVILAVAGGLVAAALILIIAVHILDVHAEQQCARLHDLTQRSLQQNQDQTHYQYRSGESQLCCMCGSVRNRRLQICSGNNSNSSAKSNPKLSTVGGLWQPLVDAACGKSCLSSGSLECLSGLSSKRKRMASGLQGGWFNGRSFFKGNGSFQDTNGKTRSDCSQAPISSIVSASAESSCSTSAVALASPRRTVGGLDSESMTTITATFTTTGDPSSSSPSLRPGSAGAHDSSGMGGIEGGSCKPIPQGRLVLEILMSPSSASDGNGGALPRATGVRLKLETNASLESLASLAAAAPSGVEDALASHGADLEAIASALTSGLTGSTSCSPISTDEVTTGNVSNISGFNCALSRALDSSIKALDTQGGLATVATAKVSAAVVDKCEFTSPEFETAMCISDIATKTSTSCVETDSAIGHSGPSVGELICSTLLEKRTGGVGLPSSVTLNSLPAVSCKSRINGHTVGANSLAKAKAKAGTHNSNSNVGVVSTHGDALGSSATPLKASHNQASFGLPSDGLGSLRISVLDGGVKSKSMKDCSKGVTAEIASALAALSVESIGGKGVGMGSTVGSGGAPSVPSGRVCLPEKVDVIPEEEGPGDGSGSEQVAEEVDDRHAVAEAVEDDEGDGNKREKRKKKNRGRRQKAKAAAVAAAAASLELQEQLVNGKNSVEAVERVPVAVELEVGCTCGTPKGGCHSSGCPYPFTSSGSMVQRKIKEQYDELVRSNVARTLTLAQVGRFTTCLVEAKSALQLKSDTIQRRFTIAKSLLSKADKSSFDRLCGQIYGLEIEQKKLEEDTVVYNRLQEQLKLSPAYQKMLEYGRTHFELQPNTGQLIEKVDSQDIEISFEELLAQEKKDSFWQKHGPSRSSMQVS